jgi:hypothetical protein
MVYHIRGFWRFWARLFTCLGLSLGLSIGAFAKDNPSVTQVGHNISVGPDQKTGELTCFGCSIRVRGEVAGDVTAFGGSITLEDRGQVAGDVTGFGGDIRLDKAAKVSGDVAVFGGEIRRDPEASIGGDVTSMGGRGWIIPILLFPFVLLGLLVALVVWLVQRLLKPAVSARAA